MGFRASSGGGGGGIGISAHTHPYCQPLPAMLGLYHYGRTATELLRMCNW